jgi:hypothetical protein
VKIFSEHIEGEYVYFRNHGGILPARERSTAGTVISSPDDPSSVDMRKRPPSRESAIITASAPASCTKKEKAKDALLRTSRGHGYLRGGPFRFSGEYLCHAYYIYKLSPSALDQDDAASHLISIPKRKRSVGRVSPHEASVDYAVSPHFPRSAKIRGCNQKVFHKIIDVACQRDFEAPALVIFRLCRNLVFKIQGLGGFETTDLITLSACGKSGRESTCKQEDDASKRRKFQSGDFSSPASRLGPNVAQAL